MSEKKATRQGYGDGLVRLGKKYENVLVLDADLGHATGSLEFNKAFPNRYIEAGIAEQNLVGMAVGLSKTGYVPFATSFAVFSAGRAFEIVRNAVAYSKANVKIVGSHSGITPAGDGGTHQCIEDVAAMRALPNMTILSPCDYAQAIQMVELAYLHEGPVYIRTSREPVPAITNQDDKIEIGKAQVLRQGSDVCIVATGFMTALAIEACDNLLKENGINPTVLNIHTIKPLDVETIKQETLRCGGKILVCEEANRLGGIGEQIAYSLLGTGEVKFAHVAIDDRFGQSGLTDELLKEYGVTATNIADKARGLLS